MMPILDDLSKFYGVSNQDLIKAYSPCYLIKYNDLVFYGFIVNNVLDNEKIFVFAYDSYLIQRHLDVISTLPFISWSSPALDIDLCNIDIDILVNTIKTKKSLLIGERSKNITNQISELSYDKMNATLELVKTLHPNVTDGPEKYFLSNGYKGYISSGFVGNEMLYELIWFTDGEDVCGTNIVSTTIPELRKMYSPSIVGHFQVIKNAIESGYKKCRFSLFFPYKSVFGIPPTMYPCIKYDKLLELEKDGIALKFDMMELI